MDFLYLEALIRQQCAEAGQPIADLQLTDGMALLITVTGGVQTISTLSATDPGLAGLTLTQVVQRAQGT